MINLFDLTQAALSELRKSEWLWRSPGNNVPPRQRWFQILDPLCFGQLSRFDLRKAKKGVPGLQDEGFFFAWVCSAIEINNKFAEAYVWRSLSGNELSVTRGKTGRLQGWERSGVERHYDIDCAVVDVLIANALKPNWDWAIRASGVMTFVKAIRLVENQIVHEEAYLWSEFAKKRLLRAAQLATQMNHGEVKMKAEHLISDIDYWTKYGLLPPDSEVGEL